jgi:hypothetical protein
LVVSFNRRFLACILEQKVHGLVAADLIGDSLKNLEYRKGDLEDTSMVHSEFGKPAVAPLQNREV